MICNTLSSYYQASRASANLRSVATTTQVRATHYVKNLIFLQKFNFDKNHKSAKNSKSLTICAQKSQIENFAILFFQLEFSDNKGLFGTLCSMRVTISFNSRPSSSFTTAGGLCELSKFWNQF